MDVKLESKSNDSKSRVFFFNSLNIKCTNDLFICKESVICSTDYLANKAKEEVGTRRAVFLPQRETQKILIAVLYNGKAVPTSKTVNNCLHLALGCIMRIFGSREPFLIKLILDLVCIHLARS